MIKLKRSMVVAGFMTCAGCALAADVKVDGPWVRGTVAGQKATGAFMAITASDGAALVSASSPLAGVVELHTMSMDDGVMRMRPVPKIIFIADQNPFQAQQVETLLEQLKKS